MKPRIVITLGDPAGIGPEIVSKAVGDRAVRACCEPIVVGDPLAFALHQQALPKVEMLSTPGLNKKLPLGRPSKEAGQSAQESLRQGLAMVVGRQANALVTAPVSKESFHLAGWNFSGHTEWLARQCRVASVGMLMAAGPLRALLITRHVALADVARHCTSDALQKAARLAYDFVKNTLRKTRPRIVVCGLNPHAGDGGLIGQEEQTIFTPTVRSLQKQGIFIKGPLPADTVFRDMAQERYDMALACYHDQGMIPLKLHSPDRLVNITLGLPFIRTSPGHGTAYDIAGKSKADAKPMMEAICLAAKYSRS